MEMVKELREAGFDDAADMLEVLSAAMMILEKNAYYAKWLDYWRKENGESNLTYPDAKEIYLAYWTLRDKYLLLEQENEILRHQVDRYRAECGFIGLESRL